MIATETQIAFPTTAPRAARRRPFNENLRSRRKLPITTAQRTTILADWWPAACETQGWNKSDRAQRLHIISQAVGREVESLNDLNRTSDIDKVKAYLGYLADKVQGAMEHGHDEYGYRRRLYWLIRQHSSHLGGEPYVMALARDRFHLTAGLKSIEDLTTDQLHKLMVTLNNRRQDKEERDRQAAAELAAITDDNTPF